MRKWEKALIAELPRKFGLLDIGARDGLQSPWVNYSASVAPTLIEPDLEEAKLIISNSEIAGTQVLPYALWSENPSHFLKLTKSSGCSSLFNPNTPFLNRFPEADRFSVESEIPVNAVSLDSLSLRGEIPEVDFAKIDVQGA